MEAGIYGKEKEAGKESQAGSEETRSGECLAWKRSGAARQMREQQQDGVSWLYFPSFEETGLVRHGFSTRLGGVSKGDCATMNFAQNRGDDPLNIKENYRRMAAALGFAPECMVLSKQTHTTNIRQVTQADAGKGYSRERDYEDIDGLMTDVPGLVLVTSYADCVPLLFLDPVRRVVAASHSGWRGTAAGMGRRTVQAMKETYGCRPENILAGIGPSICRQCYEVGKDVAKVFMEQFGSEGGVVHPLAEKPDKYLLDLQAANKQILQAAGVPEKNITVTDICTCCNKELLFSHRGSRGRRGNMAAFLALK